MSDLLDISKASFVSSCILFCVIQGIMRPAGYPRSVIPIDLVLTIMVVGGARFAVRAYTERARTYGTQRDTLIIGAGMAGSAIMRELKQNPNSTYNPIGFVDDDPSKKGIKIHGTKVLGNTDQLNELIARHDVECVLIAIPSPQGPEIAEIVRKVRECRVEFKILPTISELIDKPSSVNQVRKLRLEDLLNRRPVQLDFAQITAKLAGKTLLVTGAGGSIGSELVRQLARVNPRQLVLFERSENDLFKLCTELSNVFPKLNYVPVVGDILDVALLREVFSTYRPQSVFHAAAYKHVPMMERNCFQAVTNNIFGTYNVAMMARQYQVEDFVLDLLRQGGQPHQHHGRDQAHCRADHPRPASQPHPLSGRALRQCAGQQRQRGAVVRTADCQEAVRSRSPILMPAIFHDHTGGRAASAAGLHHGPGRRNLCARHG